ncbi:MAG: LysE family translocator [Candidatus Hydrogenedentes bacterium]|nr:LysE family translocator [Candidatus Hydrogenedentota bacterium]
MISFSIHPAGAVALFTATALLAAVPGASVIAVSARAAAGGFRHGLYTALGVTAGDLVFLITAFVGLSAVSNVLGEAGAAWLSLACGAYLIVLGGLLLRPPPKFAPEQGIPGGGAAASFLLGLAITLGDQKAVLFYAGFLPAFVDVHVLTRWDCALIAVAILTPLTLVKLLYAAAASRAGVRVSPRLAGRLGKVASCVLVAVGVWLVVRALPGLLRVYAGVGMEL